MVIRYRYHERLVGSWFLTILYRVLGSPSAGVLTLLELRVRNCFQIECQDCAIILAVSECQEDPKN